MGLLLLRAQPPATELTIAMQEPPCIKKPHTSLNLGKASLGGTEQGSGCSGTFHFLCLWQTVKESLFLKEERRLCVRGEGAVPPTKRRMLDGMWPPAFMVLFD